MSKNWKKRKQEENITEIDASHSKRFYGNSRLREYSDKAYEFLFGCQ